jgi:hypothetical protein
MSQACQWSFIEISSAESGVGNSKAATAVSKYHVSSYAVLNYTDLDYPISEYQE